MLLYAGMQSGSSLCTPGKLLPLGLPGACRLYSQAPALQPRARGSRGTQAPETEAPELQARTGEEGQGRDGHFMGQYGKLPRYCWVEGLSAALQPGLQSGPAARGLRRGWDLEEKRTLSRMPACCVSMWIHQGRKNAGKSHFVDRLALFICCSFGMDFHSLSIHSLTH